MSKTAQALFLLLLLVYPAILPAPHPDARLFSNGWGASSIIDPGLCVVQLPDQANRLALREIPPIPAQWNDRLVLLLQYLLWGIMLPIIALTTFLAPSVDRAFLKTPQASLLFFGLLGLSSAYFQWELNPAFVELRQWLAEIWLNRWPMSESQFIWLDTLALSTWLLAGAVLVGGSCFAATWYSARLAQLDWHRLAQDLMPLTGIALFLGLTQTTALYLRGEGIPLQWLPSLRIALLAIGVTWTSLIGFRTLMTAGTGRSTRKAAAALLWLVPTVLLAAHCWAMLFHWTNRYHV